MDRSSVFGHLSGNAQCGSAERQGMLKSKPGQRLCRASQNCLSQTIGQETVTKDHQRKQFLTVQLRISFQKIPFESLRILLP